MFWLIFLTATALDQLSKWLVVSNMQYGESIPVIDQVFHLTYTLNRGASFSILQGQRWFFVIFTLIVIAACIYLQTKIPRDYRLLRAMMALFCGGSVGNFIDRARQGAVIDFFDFRVFPVFNIADSCIVVSIIIICCLLLFGRAGKLLEKKHE